MPYGNLCKYTNEKQALELWWIRQCATSAWNVGHCWRFRRTVREMNSGSQSCPETWLHFIFNTMPTVLMKKQPRLPQQLQWELRVQPSPSPAQQTKGSSFGCGADSLQANSLLPNFACEGCGFADKLCTGRLNLMVSWGVCPFWPAGRRLGLYHFHSPQV